MLPAVVAVTTTVTTVTASGLGVPGAEELDAAGVLRRLVVDEALLLERPQRRQQLAAVEPEAPPDAFRGELQPRRLL